MIKVLILNSGNIFWFCWLHRTIMFHALLLCLCQMNGSIKTAFDPRGGGDLDPQGVGVHATFFIGHIRMKKLWKKCHFIANSTNQWQLRAILESQISIEGPNWGDCSKFSCHVNDTRSGNIFWFCCLAVVASHQNVSPISTTHLSMLNCWWDRVTCQIWISADSAVST